MLLVLLLLLAPSAARVITAAVTSSPPHPQRSASWASRLARPPASPTSSTASSAALVPLPTVTAGHAITAVSAAPVAQPGARLGPGVTPLPSRAALPQNLVLPRSWPPAPGAGVWLPAGRQVAGQVAMERTFVLPDAQQPAARVDLVWITPTLAHVHLAAGTRQPRLSSGLHGTGTVPLAARPRLLAAFNGGATRLRGPSAGGFRANDRWYRSPSPGLATLAIYPSGRVLLGTWGQDLPATPWGNVTPSAPLPRDLVQTLPLLVDHGRIAGPSAAAAARGDAANNAVRVWRSGLGQTATGDLLYAAGTGVTAQTLAQVLEVAGARRAMALATSSDRVTFAFSAPGASPVLGQLLVPAMAPPAAHPRLPASRSFVYLTAAC